VQRTSSIRLLAFIGLLAILSPLLTSHGPLSASTVDVTDPDYEVLSAYVTNSFAGKVGRQGVGADISSLVIVNVTKSDRDDTENEGLKSASLSKLTKYLRKNAPVLNTATIKDFRRVNSVRASFARRFDLPVGYELVAQIDIDSIFKNHGWWPDYYKKYPGSRGWLQFSRVGFSPDGKQALFYVVRTCGDLCGGGSYVVMAKKDSGWITAKEIPVWAA
jgi:hypothetical protein